MCFIFFLLGFIVSFFFGVNEFSVFVNEFFGQVRRVAEPGAQEEYRSGRLLTIRELS